MTNILKIVYDRMVLPVETPSGLRQKLLWRGLRSPGGGEGITPPVFSLKW